MKTLSIFLLFIGVTSISFAKKVKFAVDMSQQVVNVTGVHIVGDFQTLAGFPGGDWISSSTPMTQEGTSSIYSIVVDIPAFQKYEYKFVNGIQFYEAEFVPYESRVGYDFNDNRWLYVDSLANDTTFVGAILFADNAPMGKQLIRFYTNMYQETVSSNGVHVITNTSNFNSTANWMYTFGSDLYEIILYADSASNVQYAFLNGNTLGDMENIPSLCNVQGYRSIDAVMDTLLTKVCFASCEFCSGVGIRETMMEKLHISPNPATNSFTISSDSPFMNVTITDINGRAITIPSEGKDELMIPCSQWSSGIYWIHATTENGKWMSEKIIIQ